MTTVEEIEMAIKKLHKNEVVELSIWFEKFESELWDEQIERDEDAGRFDDIRDQAIAEFEAGRTEPL